MSQNKAVEELVKLGLLPTDAAVSQRKFSQELNRSMRLGLMLSDTPLVKWTTKGAVLPVKNQKQFDS